MKFTPIYSLAISFFMASFCNGTSIANPEPSTQTVKAPQAKAPESKVKNDALELATEQNDAAVAALLEYDFKTARPLLKAALKERTALLGENNPCTILSMNNLACFWYSEIVQGKKTQNQTVQLPFIPRSLICVDNRHSENSPKNVVFC